MKHVPCKDAACLACNPVARRKRTALEVIGCLLFVALGAVFLFFRPR